MFRNVKYTAKKARLNYPNLCRKFAMNKAAMSILRKSWLKYGLSAFQTYFEIRERIEAKNDDRI